MPCVIPEAFSVSLLLSKHRCKQSIELLIR
jgi:hypothetical protein